MTRPVAEAVADAIVRDETAPRPARNDLIATYRRGTRVAQVWRRNVGCYVALRDGRMDPEHYPTTDTRAALRAAKRYVDRGTIKEERNG